MADAARLALAGGDWRADWLPDRGGALAALSWRGLPVLAPLPPGADPNAAFCGAFVMAPWANRLDAGRLPVAGRLYRVPVNRPDEDTAIHGLVRDRPWQVAEAAPDRATLVQTLDAAGLPWRCRARLALGLGARGVTLALSLTNLGPAPFPFGLGWHPFFLRPPGTHLAFAAGTRFGRDARRLAMAPEPSTGIAGDEAAYGGLDTHFAGWDGLARIRRPDLRLRLAATGAWATNLQVFAPAGSPVLCVEPVSHVPDAPNRPDLARFGPMTLLPPGTSLGARLTLAAAPADA